MADVAADEDLESGIQPKCTEKSSDLLQKHDWSVPWAVAIPQESCHP
jgi:hypothetical protein